MADSPALELTNGRAVNFKPDLAAAEGAPD
jgi:hypothetical protein